MSTYVRGLYLQYYSVFLKCRKLNLTQSNTCGYGTCDTEVEVYVGFRLHAIVPDDAAVVSSVGDVQAGHQDPVVVHAAVRPHPNRRVSRGVEAVHKFVALLQVHQLERFTSVDGTVEGHVPPDLPPELDGSAALWRATWARERENGSELESLVELE